MVVLVSQDSLSRFSPIALNTNFDRLYPHILRAQADLSPLLGAALYGDLCLKVGAHQDDPTVPIPDNYLALLDAVAPVLCCRAVYYALPSVWMSVTQKGVTAEASENSRTASKGELVFLMDDVNSAYCSFRDMFVSFMSSHAADYPLYAPEGTVPEPQRTVCFY